MKKLKKILKNPATYRVVALLLSAGGVVVDPVSLEMVATLLLTMAGVELVAGNKKAKEAEEKAD